MNSSAVVEKKVKMPSTATLSAMTTEEMARSARWRTWLTEAHATLTASGVGVWLACYSRGYGVGVIPRDSPRSRKRLLPDDTCLSTAYLRTNAMFHILIHAASGTYPAK
jgi:hypothetical protein